MHASRPMKPGVRRVVQWRRRQLPTLQSIIHCNFALFLAFRSVYKNKTDRLATAMSLFLLAALFVSCSHAFAPATHASARLQVTWEPEAESNIRSLFSQRANPSANPLMVAVCGIPGSGKSTGADILGSSLTDVGCLVFPHVSH